MTYTTQLTRRGPMPIPQFMITMLAAFVLVLVLSSPARAQWTTGTNINNTNSGTVSVGTTSPGGDKLVTAGNILGGNITSHTQLYSGYDSQANVIMELGYGTATADTTPLASLVLSKNLTSANNPIGVITFANSSIANGNEKRLSAITSWTDGATNSGSLQLLTSSSGVLNERMRITSAGNVGFGTTNPLLQTGATNRMVEIQGSMNPGLALTATSVGGRQYFLYSAQTNPGYFSIFDATAGADRLTVNSSGNVGIGTASPSSLLHLRSASHTYLQIGAPLAYQSSISFSDDSNGEDIVIYRPENTRDFSIWTANSSRVLTVTQSGNVGIGNTAPTAKLDVSGNLNTTGTITGGTIVAKYQDVAEWVPASQALPAGTVVTLDPTKSNHVEASSQAYDTRVAGVVSEQPGITLGESGESKVLVATTGRVRVTVDASHAPIQIGDLLVTSDIAGVAMKSEPITIGGRKIHSPGTLIGKALEPLEQGSGKILVLLSLQ
jgi:hypothetical protein